MRAAAVHPGGIQTELGRYTDPNRMQAIVDQIDKQLEAEGKPPFQWKTIPQGAATSVWAAVVASAMRSAVDFARTATSEISSPTMQLSPPPAKEYEHMRSIQILPRSSGKKVKRWSASLFSRESKVVGWE